MSQGFKRFAANCPHRRVPPSPRRPANALNLEAGYFPLARCTAKPPADWPANMVLRWLGSGGELFVFGLCSPDCALGQRWCPRCDHRIEHHGPSGCCVRDDETPFPCACATPGSFPGREQP